SRLVDVNYLIPATSHIVWRTRPRPRRLTREGWPLGHPPCDGVVRLVRSARRPAGRSADHDRLDARRSESCTSAGGACTRLPGADLPGWPEGGAAQERVAFLAPNDRPVRAPAH